MNLHRQPLLVWMLLALFSAVGAFGQEDGEEKKKKDEAEKVTTHTETVVVTASRTEQPLDTAPAAVTVLMGEALESTPAENYGDVLRNVPGVNVSQMSARDIQVTSRGATNSLATSQLVLLDNRSLYLDFFGFVMWDFAPLDPNQIKQIEVVRGPGSAVWGANAMTGVINILTKSPKENPGTTVILGGGQLGTANASISHAGVNGKLGYRIDASYYEQDSYDRPTGVIPGTDGPLNPGGTMYPAFQNQGTSQPKFNLRFDWDTDGGSYWTMQGGWAATDGIIHTGIGPFDIESGTSLSYTSVDWKRKSHRLSFFINALDGDAPALLARDTMGIPILFSFKSETYNLDYSNTNLIGTKNVLTYGINARKNEFDLSIAPMGDSREEFGGYVQNEMLLSDKVRWSIGARIDDIDPIGTVVSPRTSLLVKIKPKHTLRFSFNRAFRAPSMVQNFLDIIFIPTTIDLSMLGGPAIFPIVSAANGNVGLTEEQLDAIEVGYVARLGNTDFTASLYRNETSDSVDFFTAATYNSMNPPPGWAATMLPTVILDNPPFANALPALFSYRNIGEIVDQGVELSVNTSVNQNWSYFFNYSWQDDPEVTGIPQEFTANGQLIDAINQPPTHRANFGVSYDSERWYANSTINYQDDAFWTDVLSQFFWGPTESFTMVNASVGVRFGDTTTLSITANNLFDEDAQQHVFGDILERRVIGQLLFRF